MDLEQRSMPYSNVQQSMVQELHKCSKTWRKTRSIQNFSQWPRGEREESCCMSHTKRHVPLFKHTVNPDDDQPIVLITATTESAAFQIGGSTIHSIFLLHDNFKSKPSWEKSDVFEIRAHDVVNN